MIILRDKRYTADQLLGTAYHNAQVGVDKNIYRLADTADKVFDTAEGIPVVDKASKKWSDRVRGYTKPIKKMILRRKDKKYSEHKPVSLKNTKSSAGKTSAFLLGGPGGSIGRKVGRSVAVNADSKGDDDKEIIRKATSSGAAAGALAGAGGSLGSAYLIGKGLDKAAKSKVVDEKVKELGAKIGESADKAATESLSKALRGNKTATLKLANFLYNKAGGKKLMKGQVKGMVQDGARKVTGLMEKGSKKILTKKGLAIAAGIGTVGGVIGGARGANKDTEERILKRAYKESKRNKDKK